MGDFCEFNLICIEDVFDVTIFAVAVTNTIVSDSAYHGLDSAVKFIVIFTIS